MATDDKKKEGSGSSELKNFEWIPAKVPIPEIYSNYVHFSWSLHDVRLLFGQLKPEFGNSQNFVVEERGAVNLSWGQAKRLSNMLTGLIDKYEEANGEITQVKLADRPE
jgi:Protein of unknown function (DUF3467)